MAPIKSLRGPYLRTEEGSRAVMADMLIALSPSLVWGTYVFGFRALVILALSLISFGLLEWGMKTLLKRRGGLEDLSVFVGASIFAMALPAGVSLWVIPLGALLAVVVFGHLTRPFTRHFLNSVLASLSILYLAFPEATVRPVQPFVHLPAFSVTPVIASDAAVEVGVLSLLKGGTIPADTDLTHFLAGVTPGGIGSVSVLLLVTGGLYLFVRRVISWQAPLCFALSAAALFYLFSPAEDAGLFMLYQIFSGGIPLALIFFGNDPDSTPVTRTGKVIFGILCGALTVLLRLGTPLVEGVGFAVMLASLLSRPLDILFRPRVYGKKRDLWRILSEIPDRIKVLGTKLQKKEKNA